jgi:hypothetical protein
MDALEALLMAAVINSFANLASVLAPTVAFLLIALVSPKGNRPADRPAILRALAALPSQRWKRGETRAARPGAAVPAARGRPRRRPRPSCRSVPSTSGAASRLGSSSASGWPDVASRVPSSERDAQVPHSAIAHIIGAELATTPLFKQRL